MNTSDLVTLGQPTDDMIIMLDQLARFVTLQVIEAICWCSVALAFVKLFLRGKS